MKKEIKNSAGELITLHSSNYLHHVDNYPWGYTQKTEAIFSVEFSPKHGFRTVQETKNPKTGNWCKEKKSTYSEIMLPGVKENNHFTSFSWDLYHTEKMQDEVLGMCEFWDLWTEAEKKYILEFIFLKLKADTKATWIYTGMNDLNGFTTDEVIEVNRLAVLEVVACLKENFRAPVNFKINYALYKEHLKRVPEDWSPFTVKSYTLIGKEN